MYYLNINNISLLFFLYIIYRMTT